MVVTFGATLSDRYSGELYMLARFFIRETELNFSFVVATKFPGINGIHRGDFGFQLFFSAAVGKNQKGSVQKVKISSKFAYCFWSSLPKLIRGKLFYTQFFNNRFFFFTYRKLDKKGN